MTHNYETRGKVAVIQDQVDGAVEAYRAGEFASAVAIFRSIGPMIDDLLRTEPKGGN